MDRLRKLVSAVAPASVDGLMADLGVSSLQLGTRRADLVFRRKDRWTCG